MLLNFRRNFFGQSCEVVVGEDEDLRLLAEFFEDGQEGTGVIVVEGDE
jgi:hypothetical protein